MPLPLTYHEYWKSVAPGRFADYAAGRTSFVKGLAPELAITLSAAQLFEHLRPRLSQEVLDRCLDPAYTHPSLVSDQPDGAWLKNTATVGVNIRTIGSFLEVVKYALTLPDHIRGIHLLPIWEPGVAGSLYGMASWELNPEFYSDELRALGPHLWKPDHQLKVVINLLHAMGKVVGLDVIPHTDRYSEMVLANPDHFEWVRRHDTSIVSQRSWLHEEVQGAITDWLARRGPALPAYGLVGGLWQLPEADRLKLFFGHPDDYGGRQHRRIDLVDWLYQRGLEPVPATMAPPYRGLEVDPRPEAMTVDEAGRVWRDYRITKPTEMSRAFGPLTRYKLYARKNDNRDWEIDFDQPRTWVWQYLTGHYAAQQSRYGFDFMRGDMSHVQMRPQGVPAVADDYYDPLRAVKVKVQQQAPYFAYFAESFLERPNFMAYGDEVEHLERSSAEVTLGNLQSLVPGGTEFWAMIDHYLAIAAEAQVTPAWTVITGDKDDPRFDHFHHWGELTRTFTGLFLGILPLYYSLGFEQRDRHFRRAANELYSKLYVFQETRPDKAVTGPFVWGSNLGLFTCWTQLHAFAEGIMAHLGPTKLLQASVHSEEETIAGEHAGGSPVALQGAEGGIKNRVLAWLRSAADGDGAYLFIAHFGPQPLGSLKVTLPKEYQQADLLFTTSEREHEIVQVRRDSVQITKVEGGICYLLT